MTAYPRQRCPSDREIEICAILGYTDEGEYTHLDGCGYADDSGKCHYQMKRKIRFKLSDLVEILLRTRKSAEIRRNYALSHVDVERLRRSLRSGQYRILPEEVHNGK